jgi:hypothetical protein
MRRLGRLINMEKALFMPGRFTWKTLLQTPTNQQPEATDFSQVQAWLARELDRRHEMSWTVSTVRGQCV